MRLVFVGDEQEGGQPRDLPEHHEQYGILGHATARIQRAYFTSVTGSLVR
jgi:hypothetical protein